MGALYTAFRRGETDPLLPLEVQYADYAQWQRSWLQGEELTRQIAFWKSHLSGAPALLDLPLDRPRPSVQRFRGAIERIELAPAFADALRDAGRREHTTLFMTMFNDPTNAAQILPDIESLDEIEHQYGEAATLARLAWNPRFDPKLERRLRRVSCPTLVVRAEHDRLVPDEIAERYAEVIEAARIETVPGTGHAIIVEQPERTADLISSFIEEHA